MFDTIAFILVIINTALLLIVFRRLQTSASKQDIVKVMHLISSRPVTLVENVEKIKKGTTKKHVSQLLGEADHPTDDEWIYHLDEHSGYAIAFDSAGRVEEVNAWRS